MPSESSFNFPITVSWADNDYNGSPVRHVSKCIIDRGVNFEISSKVFQFYKMGGLKMIEAKKKKKSEEPLAAADAGMWN